MECDMYNNFVHVNALKYYKLIFLMDKKCNMICTNVMNFKVMQEEWIC